MQAQSRLRALQATANRVGSGIKKLTLAFSGLFAVFGSFLAGKVLGQIFSGASDEAKAAEQRTRQLLVYLMQMDEIRKKGPAEAQKQLEILYAHNRALEAQGVLHHSILDAMDVSLIRSHIPVKDAQLTTNRLADVLVVTRGINASIEEGTKLSNDFAKAVTLGNLRSLSGDDIRITKEQRTEFSKAANAVERYAALMKILGDNYGHANANAQKTPVGRIQMFQNAVKTMQETLGEELIPLQAELADSWRAALPELRPLLVVTLKLLLKILTKLGHVVRTELLPWWREFQKSDRFQQLKNVLHWIEKHIRPIALAVGVLVAALIGLNVLTSLVGIITALTSPIGLVILAVAALAAGILLVYENWDKIKEMFPTTAAIIEHFIQGFKLSFKTGFDAVIAIWKTVVALFTGDWQGVGEAWKKVWEDMKALAEWWKTSLVAIAKEVGKAFKDYFLSVFEDIKTIWTWMKGFSWEGIKKAFSDVAIPEDVATGGDPYAAQQNAARAAKSVAPTAAAGKGVASTFGALEQQHGLPPGFLSAVAKQEGVNPAYNNPLGLSGPHGPYHYATVEQGVAAAEKQARLITSATGPYRDFVKSGYKDIDAFARVWSPVGASNDPYGTNNTEAAGIRAAMAQQAKRMATGGVVDKPTLAMVGERGPEAVVPLGRGHGSTHVNFTPNITINGDATPEAQAAMNTSLKNLAREFVSNFKRAQSHERRLSYESGYG